MSDEDNIWQDIKENAILNHKKRVAKTPERIIYAIDKFKTNGIRYKLSNKSNGYFHVYDKNNNIIHFWASTGKIAGVENYRGIHYLLKLLLKDK